MGGDGGQVIDRATMVRTKGWGLTKARNGGQYAASLGEMANYVQMVSEDRGLGYLERRRIKMTQCQLSQQQLKEPMVGCRLGNMYNKEALINALLNKTIPPSLAHLRALKDVKPLMVTWGAAGTTERRQGGDCALLAPEERHLACPVSGEDLDTGGARAVIIWTSGAVVSAKTLKEMKLKECPVTMKAFDLDKDIIPIVPDEEELKKLQERLPTRKKKALDSHKFDPMATAEVAPKHVGEEAAPKKADRREAFAFGPDRGKLVSQAKSLSQADDSVEPAAKKAKRDMTTRRPTHDTGVYKKLLFDGTVHDTRAGMTGDGFTGSRDGFGTPAFNRGSNIS